MADKDGLMIAILEGMKKKGEDSEEGGFEVEEAGEDDYSVGYDSAVEEMFHAFESKDVSGFKEALKSFIELCVDEDDGSTDEI